jgi:ribulose-bisphosphate carboxylase large chain
MADMRQMWIAPAGGMSLDRIPEMVKFYGVDTALLIGGALSRGDLFENSKRMVEKAHSYC